MNRIILIGNGFDLAHGLETSYRNFIDWYWNKKIDSIRTREKDVNVFPTYEYYVEDEDILFSLPHRHIDEKKITNRDIFIEYTEFRNKFLEAITKECYENWVDIEEVYFKCLKHVETKDYIYDDIDKLNNDFESIKLALDEYLSSIKVENYNPNVNINLYSPLKLADFSDKMKEVVIKDITYQILDVNRNIKDKNKYIHLAFCDQIRNSINEMYSNVKDESETYETIEKLVRNSSYSIDKYLSRPQNTLLLNFNYTNFADRYDKKSDEAYWLTSNTIHIHGELSKNNPINPMIFGYGDELSDNYKKMEDYFDNKFLRNVKSINYLQTDNYTKLLSFIESAPYQIFIMGHSCGNSDRTLLNTLFENKNCASIKVFYHQWKDKNSLIQDNYTDIIQNISRNFTQKKKMRELVVNKLYCEPLIKVEN